MHLEFFIYSRLYKLKGFFEVSRFCKLALKTALHLAGCIFIRQPHCDPHNEPIKSRSSQAFLQSLAGSRIVASKAGAFDLYKIISDYPDFPKAGILFRDINPVFRNYEALGYITNEFHRRFSKAKIDAVAGIESRGFVIATALALKFGTGMIMIRKAGKLPGDTAKRAYEIEYG